MTEHRRLFTKSPLIIAAVLCLTWALSASGQSSVATATEASASSGRPSTFQVRRNVLLQQQAILENQIRVATLCIQNASKPQMLRDPQGNINQVPKLDIIDCTRQLRTYQRKLASLARQVERLAADANATAGRLQREQGIAQRALRTRWITGD
ncbi:MAG: hypothetical protein HY912_23490 [Desulfomonile tiedjei]|uniref:P pilus assembly/Cpx signaling pathway, periplasmic inhibitor/zinc-resistance associated protein n=1 Tax=Desulfomonile tiedjei TaxID=2358 RepID=A0A9D6V6K1_9BACT|nr:hypothetical protein [Desulfomonile tiedjei]